MRQLTASQLAAMSDREKRETFREMAREYQKEHNCRWSEACLEVKRRYPESRVTFGAPPSEYKDYPATKTAF